MEDNNPPPTLAAERNAYLQQRDEAIGERNELRRQLDIALGERNELRRQLDEGIGQSTEHLRQRDEAIGERNELRRQLDEAIGEANLSAEVCDRYVHRADMTATLRGRILLFLHLPKTGGMTLAGILARNFRPDEFLQVRTEEIEPSALGTWPPAAAELAIARMPRPERLRAVWGHWGPGARACLPRPCATITLLRDPRELIVSAYHYSDARARLGQTLDEFMADRPDYPIGFDNPQTRVLSGRPDLNPADPGATTATHRTVTEEDFAVAVEVLNDCMVAGVTEQFDETLLILAGDLGWTLSDIVYTRLNATQSRPALADLALTTRKALSDLTTFDARLHTRAREHLQRRIQSYHGPFERELLFFRQINAQFQVSGSVGRLRAYERDNLRQRDEALGERNELRRQLDEALGEANELRRQVEALRTERAQGMRQASSPPRRHASPQNSIFLATLPKSGTEFVWGAIRDATKLVSPMVDWDEDLIRAYFSGYCNREDVYSTGVFTSERLILDGMRRLAPTGYVCASHCAATHHNLCVLRDAGFERASVLVRDPRDSTVSWTHHLRALGPGMVAYNSQIQRLPPGYFNLTHEGQLAFQVRTFLPAAMNWLESWLAAAIQPRSEQPVEIQFVFFDHLREDPAALVESVLRFHRVGYYDLSKVQPPTPGKRHFRNGESGTWREEMSPADREFSNGLIGNRIENLFDRMTVAA